ncbi:hypothetical protein DVH24_029845 [Malus domestica]|uniref:Glucose-6-phosphate 1-epimerase n=1 Tax=Malus domestica TaxID=3750 RepID=A0A498HY94_MALDO|nr:hypothetical protein DVH24_029845 [Malus domestica]
MEWNHTLPQNNPLDEEDGDDDDFYARFAPHPYFSEPPPSQPVVLTSAGGRYIVLTSWVVVEFAFGNGNLNFLLKLFYGLMSFDACSEADAYLYGRVITSWKVPNGRDLLFVRPDALGIFFEILTILSWDSGGVPHCFPQFGPGPMQQHGFARNLDWSVIDSENVQGDPTITLELKEGECSRSMWDFSFQALYKVTLQTKSLSTELVIKNRQQTIFMQHRIAYILPRKYNYFMLRGSAAVQGASVNGLKGCKTLNKDPDPKNPLEGKEERRGCDHFSWIRGLRIPGCDVISIKNTNWTDAVLWNPYLTMEACYKDFVCVENAKIGNVQLEPGNTWTATQHLSIN